LHGDHDLTQAVGSKLLTGGPSVLTNISDDK